MTTEINFITTKQVRTMKIEELENTAPQLGVREYVDQVAEAFTELPFQPLDDVWEQEFRRLFEDGKGQADAA